MPKQSARAKREALVNPTTPSARQDVAKNRRESRMKAYERNKRQWLLTKIGAAVVAVALVAGIVYLIVDSAQKNNDKKVPDGVSSYTYASGSHDDSFTAWTEVPPAGGTHNNTWQKCQYYPAPINPGMGVHALEHGAVWITYSPDLPQDQIDKLKELADGQDFILVSPYVGLPSPVVATAWNKQLKLDSVDDDRLDQFIKVFKNSPDNTPEYGANCASGSTATVG
jgi:hypothetical protein